MQFASLAWAVARIDPSARNVGSWGALFGAPTTLVVSGTYLSPLHLNLRANAIHVRAEAFTENPDEARSIIDKVNVFVALTHTAEISLGTHGTDPDVKSFFESLQVKQDGNRAVLNAAVPFGFLRKMMAESGPEWTEPAGPTEVPAKSK